MRQERDLTALVLLAIGLVLAACSSSDVEPDDVHVTTRTPPAAIPAPGPSVPPTPVKLIAKDSGASEAGIGAE